MWKALERFDRPRTMTIVDLGRKMLNTPAIIVVLTDQIIYEIKQILRSLKHKFRPIILFIGVELKKFRALCYSCKLAVPSWYPDSVCKVLEQRIAGSFSKAEAARSPSQTTFSEILCVPTIGSWLLWSKQVWLFTKSRNNNLFPWQKCNLFTYLCTLAVWPRLRIACL